MSTASHLSAFASRVAFVRSSWANLTGDGDSATPNFQVGTDGTGKKFRAAFDIFANQREAVDAGFEANCQGRMMLPAALGITLSADPASPTDFTALVGGEGYVAGDVFRVVWFNSHPFAAETRVGLRKKQM